MLAIGLLIAPSMEHRIVNADRTASLDSVFLMLGLGPSSWRPNAMMPLDVPVLLEGAPGEPFGKQPHFGFGARNPGRRVCVH
jgi:hypothetical protein